MDDGSGGSNLFTTAFSTTADNGIKVTNTSGLSGGALSDDLLSGGGQVSVDGLLFNSTVASVLRYRTTADAANTTGVSIWNTNGSFYTSNASTLPAVGVAVNSGLNVRTYLAVPVTSGVAFDVTVTYKQTSSGQTHGSVALIGSDNIILAEQPADYAQAGSTITYHANAGHSLTNVKIFYSRDTASGGGMNVTQIVRVQ